MNQEDKAKASVIDWLSSPHELGKEPAEIECTRSFTHDAMTYYIFKFKKNHNDKEWQLGVCGGYEKDSDEHCGHVFSDFKEYNKPDEVKDATKIIEWIGNYWKKLNQTR